MFRIDWDPDVQLELLERWALAPDALQARISAAINSLEHRLASDPFDKTESREDDKRVMFELPLGIEFTVNTASLIVHVERVWLVKERQ